MRIVLSILALVASQSCGLADDERESAFRGRRIAEANCGACHALARTDRSTLSAAPPLREVGANVPYGKLREMLRGPVFLKHVVMPDFDPDGQQADDLAAYIRSIAQEDD